MRKILFITTFFIVAQNFLFAQTYTVTYEKEQKPNLKGQLSQIKDPVLRKQLESRVIVTSYQLLHKDGVSNFSVKQENEDKAADEDRKSTRLNSSHVKI